MLLLLLLLQLRAPGLLSVPIPAPVLSPVPFDCRRMHPAFCCSSRVRHNCGQLCLSSASSCPAQAAGGIQVPPQLPLLATSFGGSIDQASVNVPGPGLGLLNGGHFQPDWPAGHNNNFGHQRRFNTEGEQRQTANTWVSGPENANPGSFSHQPAQQPPMSLILPPMDTGPAQGTPVPIEDLDKELVSIEGAEHPTGGNEDSQQTEVAAASAGAESAATAPFPTLRPPSSGPELQPSIDIESAAVEANGGEKASAGISRTEGGAMDGTASSANAKRNGTRRSGGTALKPAHLMGELEELEAKEDINNDGGGGGGSQQQQWWAPIRLSLVDAQREGNFNAGQPRTTVTEGSIGAATFTGRPPTSFEEGPFPSSSGGQQFWSFRVKPSNGGDAVEEQSESAAGNIKVPDGTRLPADLPLGMNGGGSEQPRGALFGENIEVFVDKLFNREVLSSIATITGRNRSSIINGGEKASAIPSIAGEPECGHSPDFKPCVPLEQANVRLKACCQSKLLPAGCLALCRYETSQQEVKMAFDKGQCGILNVTPFLECASQGNNNLDCCRHREIIRRTGSQCEVFCTGEKLGLLGLQHLVCSTQIQPILECHHSGLKP